MDSALPVNPVPIENSGSTGYIPSMPKNVTPVCGSNNNIHVMVTRSKDSIMKKIVFVVEVSESEPISIKQALGSSLWQAAIKEEYDAFLRNNKSSLVFSFE